MKYLIIGASGMAGHMISIFLSENGHDVTGYCRRTINYIPSVKGDVQDTDLLKKVLLDGDYDIIVNAAGVLNHFAEQNKAQAVFVNSYLPYYLSFVTRNSHTRIIHLSTDCVFSGRSGGYDEYSFPDGESFYDRTKSLGELKDDKNVTLRNSVVGPDINENGIGLLNWFMIQKDKVDGYTQVKWTGLTSLELAKIIELISVKSCSGLYNMVPLDYISKYQLLMLFNQHIRKDKIQISKSATPVCNKVLIRTRYDFGYVVPSYESMIKELADWMREHKNLYPHYVL